MTNDKYFYPVPYKHLLNRFKKPFQKLHKNQSATILALPYTGRTSHLRFITSQENILKDLGVNMKNTVVTLIDIDKTVQNYESFILEVIYSLEASAKVTQDEKKTHLSSQDTYLLSKYLLSLVSKITKNKTIYLIVTLNEKVKNIMPEIDNLLVLAQKSTSDNKLNILWSIDTKAKRNYEHGHPSSTFLENTHFFPTFSKEETLHSIQRIAETKGIQTPKVLSSDIMEKTGGIAGFFHQFIKDPNFIESAQSLYILQLLKKEIELHENVISKLATSDAINLIKSTEPALINHQNISLKITPTAQEILLMDLFINNLNRPVARDEIAQTIWGKSWENKYSDWAIDKAISRLRRNMNTKDCKIVTVKNLGYQLYKPS
jgi:hypothetical protein